MKHKPLRFKRFLRENKLVIVGFAIAYFVFLSLILYFESRSNHALINNYFDAIYWSIVTFTTVGYGDLYPVTYVGKAVSFIFILSGFTILGFIISKIIEMLREIREEEKKGHNGTTFTKHAVIIGWNSMSANVVEQLIGVGKKVAIVLNDMQDLEMIKDTYNNSLVFCLLADFNNYDILKKANIDKSSVVFVNLNDDTHKLVFILNLKKRYPNLTYVVNIENAELKETFNEAGVKYTVSKNEIASKLLASYIFEPDVAAFSEEIMSFTEGDNNYDIKEYFIKKDCKYVGMNCEDVFYDAKKNFNAIMIGLSVLQNGKHLLLKNPGADVIVNEGDYVLFILNLSSAKLLASELKIEEGRIY
jgi:voltage-gated potassium channel